MKYLALQNLEYPADYSDGLHPNAAGFQKVGKAWADAIMNIYVDPEGWRRRMRKWRSCVYVRKVLF